MTGARPAASWSAGLEAGSLLGMHPRFRRLLIPGVLVLLLVIVVVAAVR
ncbi:MAG: hypothetical protein H0V07_12210 [Propionibacteriales bacterium]|nr:hypothetical protein [Propionibacteriales bacterium]